MTTIELTNSFHGTSILIDAKWESGGTQNATYDYLCQRAEDAGAADCKSAKRAVRRIKRALCGMADCGCGTVRP